ncbi:hypothetical protein KC360_g8760 [Hortaea werneckii]|nr:hypothetical protein KC361_g7969 [Hortaea werneckii]KAI6878206.1 hypothetical protein KC325_g8770 [Hortaea werneckii]KAI6986084.1 hypothetical protein KC359_g8903 [Hortaea werneckii]KAI7140363.1 hypothetical protein KC344_g8766 [Hortaea werneckii]KAI7167257.1 hypothetical protein KC360_g8760 [Hortaea werneckii]
MRSILQKRAQTANGARATYVQRSTLIADTAHFQLSLLLTAASEPPLSTQQDRVPSPLPPFGSQLGHLSPNEELIVRRFSDFSQFKDFATEPNVGPEMHQQAMFSFLSNYETLHDGIFAMYGALAVSKSIEIPHFDREANTKQGAVALSKFRSLPCPSTEVDFVPWLWLGTSLVIHAHCAFGSSASPLRRYLLGHVRYLGEPGLKFAAHPVIVSMAAMDIHDSLLHGQMPMMRPTNAKQSVRDPSSLFETCAPLTMLLLFIHRLHYAYGQQDGLASYMANSIMSDLELASAATGQPARMVITPFIVAAAEASTSFERERIREVLPKYVFSIFPAARSWIKEWLEQSWQARDSCAGLRFVDLAEGLPSICIYL